jgi:hypothetical protein
LVAEHLGCAAAGPVEPRRSKRRANAPRPAVVALAQQTPA